MESDLLIPLTQDTSLLLVRNKDGQEMLRVENAVFYVRGERVLVDALEGRLVYEALRDFLVQAFVLPSDTILTLGDTARDLLHECLTDEFGVTSKDLRARIETYMARTTTVKEPS
jgi:hypothetical protein